MWFRRLFRRRPKPPPLDLFVLDRLEEIVARVIALVPQAVAAPLPAEPTPSAPELPAAAHLLFLPGYELVEQGGPPPAPGSRVEHGGRAYSVLRHGPSPLPGDRRRCAFLERT